MGRQAAGKQGRGLFWRVKGGQEDNLSSGDEDPSAGDEKGKWGGGGRGTLDNLLDLTGMHSGLDMTAPLTQSG